MPRDSKPYPCAGPDLGAARRARTALQRARRRLDEAEADEDAQALVDARGRPLARPLPPTPVASMFGPDDSLEDWRRYVAAAEAEPDCELSDWAEGAA